MIDHLQQADAGNSVRLPAAGSLELELRGQGGGYRADDPGLRTGWILDAAAHHARSCAEYGRLLAASGLDPDTLVALGDISRVPLIPSSMFKKTRLISRPDGPLTDCLSSGTMGRTSTVLRDEPTMERFVAGLMLGAREFFPRHENRRAFVLSPPPEQAGTLWFAQVMGLLELAFETDYFVDQDAARVPDLVARLASLPAGLQPILVGPPPLVLDLCQYLETSGTSLDLGRRHGFLITAGGWKRRSAERIDRTRFHDLVGRWLGIEAPQIRDLFNMVELNSLIYECEHHAKHAPPWLGVHARRPSDLSVCEPGEPGLLCFLDPTATSYPGFILSDDLGTVGADPCPCLRAGTTFSIERRITSVDERGCALKMDRYAAQQGDAA